MNSSLTSVAMGVSVSQTETYVSCLGDLNGVANFMVYCLLKNFLDVLKNIMLLLCALWSFERWVKVWWWKVFFNSGSDSLDIL